MQSSSSHPEENQSLTRILDLSFVQTDELLRRMVERSIDVLTRMPNIVSFLSSLETQFQQVSSLQDDRDAFRKVLALTAQIRSLEKDIPALRIRNHEENLKGVDREDRQVAEDHFQSIKRTQEYAKLIQTKLKDVRQQLEDSLRKLEEALNDQQAKSGDRKHQ